MVEQAWVNTSRVLVVAGVRKAGEGLEQQAEALKLLAQWGWRGTGKNYAR